MIRLAMALLLISTAALAGEPVKEEPKMGELLHQQGDIQMEMKYLSERFSNLLRQLKDNGDEMEKLKAAAKPKEEKKAGE